MAARSLTVNFRAQGERKVQAAGKKAEKALDDVGRAAEDAGEGAGGATDSIKGLSEALGEDLGPAAGEILGTFDKISGVIGQVGNAAKVLSGVAILELILQFKAFYETMTDAATELERQKTLAEAVAGAYDGLADAIRGAEKEAKLAEFSASPEVQMKLAGFEARIKDETSRLTEIQKKLLELGPEQRKTAELAAKASAVGSFDLAERLREDAAKQLEKVRALETEQIERSIELAAAQSEREVEVINLTRAEEARLKAIAETLGIEEEKRKGLAKAVDEQASAYDRLWESFKFQLAVGQEALGAALVDLAESAEAAETTAAVFAAIRAGLQLVTDGYNGIGAAVEKVGEIQAYIHQQNMQMIAAEVEADAARVQGVVGSASFLAEQLGASTKLLAGLKAADAIADAATESARAFAAFGLGNFWSGAQHSLSAAGFIVAAGKHLATAAGGGGGGAGGGGAPALSAPTPPSDSDIAGGGSRGRERGGDINVTFAGDVYDTREAADRALASRAIRGTNSLSRTAGTPRVRAAAIRQR